MSVIIVITPMPYLVTTADTAVLFVNTINTAGDEGLKAQSHIYFWGTALGRVEAPLQIAVAGYQITGKQGLR